MSGQTDAGLTRVPPPPAPPPAVETVADREVRNPFFGYMMHLGLPLSVSLAVHVAVFSFLAVKTFRVLAQPGVEIGDYEASLTQSLTDQMKDAFRWDEDNPLDAPETPPEESLESLTPDLAEMDTSALDADPGPAGESSGLGIGDGQLSLLGMGTGAGEAGAGGFGTGLGGGGARMGEAGIWDLRIRANKIVYVVDFSGSIIIAVDALKSELKRSIGRLKPSQSFDVIIFYSEFEGPKMDIFKPKLEPATEDVRREFFTWIDRRAPRGDTYPVQAVKRALSLKPEAIFLFSDGRFSDPDRDEAEINESNRTTRAKIYCLVFDEIYLGDVSALTPKDNDGSLRLKRIATTNGGTTKIVTGRDLARR